MTSRSRQQRPPAAAGLLGETRVRLLDHLCGTPQTAAELGALLGISPNAARTHLEGLRDAGLVAYRVERRGVGKPRHVYSMTASAEYLLSAAYAPTLASLLKAAAARLNGDLQPLLHEAGRDLLAETAAGADIGTVRSAVRALEALGRPVTVSRDGTSKVLGTQCCPLGAVSRETPYACTIVEAMLTAACGLPVHESCERGDQPRCRFTIEPRAPR